ncbi:MAG: NAD(P)-dependent glycerol-3-phosphate dehydrogenase [Nitrospinae bacterium]|nr:NAD(P)-dependent glycerol-3-phosphate dehydrogenase [Nitrospinota bacterium]
MTPQRIAVIGAGAWGTALADSFAETGHEVMLWVFETDLCARMASHGENDLYLPGIALHENLRFTSDLAEAASAGQDVLVSVMPSHVVRAVWTKLAAWVHEETLVASATKGVEEKTLLLPSRIITECIGAAVGAERALACLSGPTFARELAERKPTAITAASEDPEVANAIQEMLSAPNFRIYTGADPVGAQLGGALKNVIALAAGVADGMELGLNARAALIVRGLAEIARLGVAMGGRAETFAGLAGMGDLVLTCTGDLSRNRTVGVRLGQGEPLQKILESMTAVAEGVSTAPAAVGLADEYGVEMPICREVHAVLFEGRNPGDAVRDLMARPLRAELP